MTEQLHASAALKREQAARRAGFRTRLRTTFGGGHQRTNLWLEDKYVASWVDGKATKAYRFDDLGDGKVLMIRVPFGELP